VIPLAGMSTQLALRLVDSTRDAQLDLIKSSAEHSRAIDAFRDRIADVKTAEQLTEDRELYVFVMKAYDLEDQIFGKAMIRKMLESDIDDRKALVNRLTDPRLRELHQSMDFAPGKDGVSGNTDSFIWREMVVRRYVERQFINRTADENAGAGVVLEVRKRAPEITSWFDVLKNRDVSSFMRRALGLPDEMVQLDLDRQVEVFKTKFDIEKLKDPAELEKLERKYAALTDALDNQAVASNAAVTLMQGAVAAGAGGAGFVPVTIDISAISALPRGAYR